MDSASPALPVGLPDNAEKSPTRPRSIRREPWWALPGAILFTLITLALDLFMPRGASPDIGYCAAMLMAAATGRLSFLLTAAAICCVLNAIGYWLEPRSPNE